jgi:hypothetical protein
MGVAVTHRPPPACLGTPGACEIIAASFSAMVMEFLNDPGNGWYRTCLGPLLEALISVKRSESPTCPGPA